MRERDITCCARGNQSSPNLAQNEDRNNGAMKWFDPSGQRFCENVEL
jgi:hypothetical protein